MDIFEKVEDISKKGYSVEYVSVDQHQNGYTKQIKQGLMLPVTYTVYVIRLSDSETLYTESFDHIKDCLKEGIKFVEKNLIVA